MTERLLSPTQAERFYNRFGKRLDSQTFYEKPALDDLAAHLQLETCRSVVEFGCGTGRFAEEFSKPTFRSKQSMSAGISAMRWCASQPNA